MADKHDAWDLRTWAIILMVGVFAIVFARSEQAYHGVKDVQKAACLSTNERNATAIRALNVLANGARDRQESWFKIYDNLIKDEQLKVFSPVAESMIGSNAVEEQSLRELTEFIGDSAPDSVSPNSEDPQLRSQSNC